MRCIYIFLFSVTLFHAVNDWKSLNTKSVVRKKNWTLEITTSKDFEPTKYPQGVSLYLQSTNEKKFWTTKYPPEKIPDSRSTHKDTLECNARQTSNGTQLTKFSTFNPFLLINYFECSRFHNRTVRVLITVWFS